MLTVREVLLGVGHGGPGSGHAALVDDNYYELVSQYPWHVRSKGRTFYAKRKWRENGVQHTQGMHSLITGWPYVDHRDHNGLNNQWYNLREATQPQNSWNESKGPGTSSQYKGVTWRRDAGKWQAQIKVHYRNHYLGCFADEIDAARAYDAAAREAFGEFACLNIPDAC